MIGLAGVRRATVRKPARVNVDMYPVPEALGDTEASTGYASTAGAFARAAVWTAAATSTEVTPFRRYPLRT